MEKNKKNISFAFLYITVLLYACAPKPGDDDFAPTTKKEEINHIIAIAPDWFKKPPKSTNYIFYATATAKSDDYQTSIKKATLIAKAELADKISGKITAEESRKKIEKIVEGKIESASEFDINIVGQIDQQTIEGYNQEEILTISEGALFRTFILLKKNL